MNQEIYDGFVDSFSSLNKKVNEMGDALAGFMKEMTTRIESLETRLDSYDCGEN